MPDGWLPADRASRAAFARSIADHPDKWALFSIIDGKDIRPEAPLRRQARTREPCGPHLRRGHQLKWRR